MTVAGEETDRPGAVHLPVLLREVIRHLELAPGQIVVDGTVGAGGHSRKILEAIGPSGRLIGLDRDEMMLEHARRQLADSRVDLVRASYSELSVVLEELHVDAVDRILVDLGLSSDQLADEERGFGIQTGGELDMRFDRTSGMPVADLLNTASPAALRAVFEEYGEEPFSSEIADEIVRRRQAAPFTRVSDLVEAVEAAIPARVRRHSEKHPATRVFQSLRIAVNRELEHLRTALDETFPRCLKPGGLLAVISFHSLEDRAVKTAFRNRHVWEPTTSKPIVARPNEQKINPRSRSAKLRVARRITPEVRRDNS